MRKHFKKLRSKSKDTFHNILDKIKYIWHTIILFFKEKGKWRKINRLISNIHKFLKRKHIYSMLLFILLCRYQQRYLLRILVLVDMMKLYLSYLL